MIRKAKFAHCPHCGYINRKSEFRCFGCAERLNPKEADNYVGARSLRKNPAPEPTSKLRHVGNVAILGTCFGWILEVEHLNNTLGNAKLFCFGMAAGIVISFLLHGRLWNMFRPEERRGISKKEFACCNVLICALLGPCVASVTNRGVPRGDSRHIEVYVTEFYTSRGKGGRGYYVRFEDEAYQEKLRLSRQQFDQFCGEKNLSLTIYDGLWGFPVVTNIQAGS